MLPKLRFTDCISLIGKTVSFVGGGGKTSLMFRCASELSECGFRVIVSTSTHIFKPDSVPVLRDYDPENVMKAFMAGSFVCIGKDSAGGKLTAPDTVFSKLERCCDYLLIEADGAKRMPLKIPAPHEPVIPPCTSHVIAVMGIDALGTSVRNGIFRYELARGLLGKQENDPIGEEDYRKLLTSGSGLRKEVPGGAHFTAVINKADTDDLFRSAASILNGLPDGSVDSYAVTSVLKGRFYDEDTCKRSR